MSLYKRQLPNSVPVGFTGSLTVPTEGALPTSLVIDPNAQGSSLGSLAPSVTITVSSSEDPTTSSTDDSASPSETDADVASTSSAAKSSIPIGTVIGICVGVFAALAFALFLMARLSSNTRKLRAIAQKKRRSTIVDGRNSRQDIERRKSGREMWVKMDDAEVQKEKFTKAKAGPMSMHGNDEMTVREKTTRRMRKRTLSVP